MSEASNVLTQTVPGPEPAGEPMGALDVARPEPGREPERRVVGDPQPLLLVVELDHGQDRPEDLLAGDPHRVVDAVEDRRRDEVAAGLLAGPLAAGDEPRALLLRRARRSRGPCRAASRRRSPRAASSGRAARPARACAPAPRSARRAPRGPTGGRRGATRRCRSGRCCRRSPSRSSRPPPRGRRRRRGRAAGSCRRARA